MTPWFLSICTASWVMCGQYIEARYESESACYKALDDLYKRNPDGYKWVTCTPNQGANAATKKAKETK